MLVVFAVASALTLQGRGEMDGFRARRVLEASKAADAWVFEQVHTRLAPDLSIVQSSGRARVDRQAFQDACARDLTNAAYEQVCDAYGITKKQFNAIVRNPERVLAFQYTPEKRVRRLLNRQLSSWERMGTRFDPKGVRLKPSLAKRYGYINPRKPEPEPPSEPSLTLEQLIGPSPLPRRFTEPKAEELMPIPRWFRGSHEEWAVHEKRRREFAKRGGDVDYRVPGGGPLD
jgi:hypothetical protein